MKRFAAVLGLFAITCVLGGVVGLALPQTTEAYEYCEGFDGTCSGSCVPFEDDVWALTCCRGNGCSDYHEYRMYKATAICDGHTCWTQDGCWVDTRGLCW